jgi:hypothetical protein
MSAPLLSQPKRLRQMNRLEDVGPFPGGGLNGSNDQGDGLMLAIPAYAVELFRYRGTAKDGRTLEYIFETDRLDLRATERDPSREGQRKLGTYRIGQAPLQLRAAKTRRGSDSSRPTSRLDLSTKIGMRRPSLFLNERWKSGRRLLDQNTRT